MIKNQQQLQDLIKNKAKKRKQDPSFLYKEMFLEEFLKKLSLSKYKNILIFKGGFYLQKTFSLINRTTIDLDFALLKEKIEEKEIYEIVESICQTKTNFQVNFKIMKISKISQGYTLKIEVNKWKLRDFFDVDICIENFKNKKNILNTYVDVLEQEYYSVNSFEIESLVADKLDSILKRKEENSRMKDFYDIFLINKIENQSLNYKKIRKYLIGLDLSYQKINKLEIIKWINDVKETKIFEKPYKKFLENKKYQICPSFEKILILIENMINNIF